MSWILKNALEARVLETLGRGYVAQLCSGATKVVTSAVACVQKAKKDYGMRESFGLVELCSGVYE